MLKSYVFIGLLICLSSIYQTVSACFHIQLSRNVSYVVHTCVPNPRLTVKLSLWSNIQFLPNFLPLLGWVSNAKFNVAMYSDPYFCVTVLRRNLQLLFGLLLHSDNKVFWPAVIFSVLLASLSYVSTSTREVLVTSGYPLHTRPPSPEDK